MKGRGMVKREEVKLTCHRHLGIGRLCVGQPTPSGGRQRCMVDTSRSAVALRNCEGEQPLAKITLENYYRLSFHEQPECGPRFYFLDPLSPILSLILSSKRFKSQVFWNQNLEETVNHFVAVIVWENFIENMLELHFVRGSFLEIGNRYGTPDFTCCYFYLLSGSVWNLL